MNPASHRTNPGIPRSCKNQALNNQQSTTYECIQRHREFAAYIATRRLGRDRREIMNIVAEGRSPFAEETQLIREPEYSR